MPANRRHLAASLVILAVTTSGCATIINGRSQHIPLASTPPGTTVKIDGVQTTTPAKVTLRRDQDYNCGIACSTRTGRTAGDRGRDW